MFFNNGFKKRIIELETEVEEHKKEIAAHLTRIELDQSTLEQMRSDRDTVFANFNMQRVQLNSLQDENQRLLRIVHTPQPDQRTDLQVLLASLLEKSNTA